MMDTPDVVEQTHIAAMVYMRASAWGNISQSMSKNTLERNKARDKLTFDLTIRGSI